MKEIKDHIEQIKHLCNAYSVKSLFAFGSVVSDNLKSTSDIDLLVDIDSKDPIDYSDNYFELKFQLESILKRPVDLLVDVDIKTWLSDIKQAIKEINDFLPDQKNFFQFQKDLKTKRAIERNLEIIGEAAGRVLKQQPDILITDIKKIVVTRNRIIHGYDTVSDEIIWSIVVKYLPKLEAEVDALLR